MIWSRQKAASPSSAWRVSESTVLSDGVPEHPKSVSGIWNSLQSPCDNAHPLDPLPNNALG